MKGVVLRIASFPEIKIISYSIHSDNRGSFQRIFEIENLKSLQKHLDLKQISFSTNKSGGVIRGLHAMDLKVEEYKICACVSGSILDVIVDVRPYSKNYLNHIVTELNGKSGNVILIPPGFAHGYLTTSDTSSIIYAMSTNYEEKNEIGFRWNDPKININWGIITPNYISKKDSMLPLI
jgi:dTDP-4-dehydrorhamnose 3,5-epimerase